MDITIPYYNILRKTNKYKNPSCFSVRNMVLYLNMEREPSR